MILSTEIKPKLNPGWWISICLRVSISKMFPGSATAGVAVSRGSRPWSLIARGRLSALRGAVTHHTARNSAYRAFYLRVLVPAFGHSLVNFHSRSDEKANSFISPNIPALLPAGTCHVTATCVTFRYGSVASSPVTPDNQWKFVCLLSCCVA